MSKDAKSIKFGFRAIKSTSLDRVLSQLRKRYETDKAQDSLVIPYVLTCAAFLESKLNDSLYEVVSKKYGEDSSSALMSLSLPSKLKLLVPVLTDGQYIINKDHFVYQRLASLIRVRNSIAHAKSEIEEIEVRPEDMTTISSFFGEPVEVPRQFLENTSDITLGASKSFTPTEYHEALEKLDKWFFMRCPDRLHKIAMVTARSKAKEWKDVSTRMEKDLKRMMHFRNLCAFLLTIAAQAAAAQGILNLRAYDFATRQSVEIACGGEKVNGPVAYGACLDRQVAALKQSAQR